MSLQYVCFQTNFEEKDIEVNVRSQIFFISFFFFSMRLLNLFYFFPSKERKCRLGFLCSGFLSGNIVLQRKLELGFGFPSSWKMLPWN